MTGHFLSKGNIWLDIFIKPGARWPKAGAHLVLEIAFVREVGMCVCACVCACVCVSVCLSVCLVCVSVCLSVPEGINNYSYEMNP